MAVRESRREQAPGDTAAGKVAAEPVGEEAGEAPEAPAAAEASDEGEEAAAAPGEVEAGE